MLMISPSKTCFLEGVFCCQAKPYLRLTTPCARQILLAHARLRITCIRATQELQRWLAVASISSSFCPLLTVTPKN